MVRTFFPCGKDGEHQATYPLQSFEELYSRDPNHYFPSDPTGGLHDMVAGRAFAPPCHSTDSASPSETTTMAHIGSDEFYGAMQSSSRLKAMEADLARTLMSEINLLESSLPMTIPLDLLTNRKPTYNLFNHDRVEATRNCIRTERKLSTEEIMRVAAVRYIESFTYVKHYPLMGQHSIGSRLSLGALTPEEISNVDLARLLLAAAEKLNSKQYDHARSLINQCYHLSSSKGNPVQRIVYHFADALQERIDRQTDKLLSLKRPREIKVSDVNKIMLSANTLQLVFHRKIPFSQLMQFISIQAVIDAVTSATRIHVIDFSLRHGLQWTVLIQELATRTALPVEYLKVTAVSTPEEIIGLNGERLTKFAQNMGLNFEFQNVVVEEMTELRTEMFHIGAGEVLGVYLSLCMNAMIVNPRDLDHLMKVCEKLKPDVVTVVDVEGKHNSLSFISRFTEALFYYSALFDSMDVFMERDDINRMVLEERFFSEGIKCIIAAEGSDRVVRHVGISMWRSFFARFGLKECELNEWSSYQAGLIAGQFQNGSSCSLHRNGKSLMVGWKGTPLFFVSAWKFS